MLFGNNRPGPCPAGVLTIASWNVEWLFDGINDPPPVPPLDAAAVSAKVQAVAAVLEKLDADIVHLAEVENCDILDSVAKKLNRPYQPLMISGTDSFSGQQVALLTQVQAQSMTRSPERVELSNGKSTGISKHLVADFSLGLNSSRYRELEIIGLHLKARPHEPDARLQREGQAKIAQGLIRKALHLGKDVIVLGDFNDLDADTPGPSGERPSSSVLRMLKDVDNDGRADLWNALELVPQAERYTAWHDKNRDGKFQFSDERSMIDHILVSESLRRGVEAVGVLHKHNPEEVSDHWPVWLRINLEALSVQNPNKSDHMLERHVSQDVLWGCVSVAVVIMLGGPFAYFLWKQKDMCRPLR